MALVFLFLDGVGLGSSDRSLNPFAAASTPFLEAWLGSRLTRELPAIDRPGKVFRSCDATLGLPGLPQSATGQTSLLTGKNGAVAMGRHYGPWPGPTLHALLRSGTIFHLAQETGGARLANVYPPTYLEALAGRRLRLNAPVFAAREAGVRLRSLESYRLGRAVSADLTGAFLAHHYPGLSPATPSEAGRVLTSLAEGAALVFFDFWLSDRVGHRGSFTEAVALVEALDEFLGAVFASRGGHTVVVASDHGNIEDMASRTHTLSPVPLLVEGPGAEAFGAATTLTQVGQVAADHLAATAL